jgi:hypothetical protein
MSSGSYLVAIAELKKEQKESSAASIVRLFFFLSGLSVRLGLNVLIQIF